MKTYIAYFLEMFFTNLSFSELIPLSFVIIVNIPNTTNNPKSFQVKTGVKYISYDLTKHCIKRFRTQVGRLVSRGVNEFPHLISPKSIIFALNAQKVRVHLLPVGLLVNTSFGTFVHQICWDVADISFEMTWGPNHMRTFNDFENKIPLRWQNMHLSVAHFSIICLLTI